MDEQTAALESINSALAAPDREGPIKRYKCLGYGAILLAELPHSERLAIIEHEDFYTDILCDDDCALVYSYQYEAWKSIRGESFEYIDMFKTGDG
jgi:hypothetical protein